MPINRFIKDVAFEIKVPTSESVDLIVDVPEEVEVGKRLVGKVTIRNTDPKYAGYFKVSYVANDEIGNEVNKGTITEGVLLGPNQSRDYVFSFNVPYAKSIRISVNVEVYREW